GAVVGRFRLLHPAVRPLADVLLRRQRDADGVEGVRVLGLLEEIENVLHGFSRSSSCFVRSRWGTPRRVSPSLLGDTILVVSPTMISMPRRYRVSSVPPPRPPAPSPSARRPGRATGAP